MANKVTITIEADGTVAVSNMEKIGQATDRMVHRHGQGMSAMREATKHAHGGMTDLEKGIMSVQMRIMNLTMAAGLISAPFVAGAAVSIKYLSTIETANLGIASAFMTSGKYIDETTGKALQGEAALRAAQYDSKQVIQELQVANMQTIATLDELVRAYQETLPVAMARGFNRDQVVAYTTAMVQAAGAIGLQMNQLGEETRSMLTGAIDPRTSRIATVLGLRNEDIAKFKGDAQGLFDFLMGKLEAYRIAGIESQKTWAGLTSNTKDILLQMGGQAFEPLFEAVKYELAAITSGLVTIDEQTKKITWNPEFVSGTNSVREGVNSVIAEVYRLNMMIDLAGGTMTAFGSRTLKVAEIVTRVMTIGQFGDSLKGGSEQMAQWNKMYEQRYQESEKALQALANREAGLDANGKPLATGQKTPYQQNPPPGPGEKELEKQRKAAEKARRDRESVSLVMSGMQDRDLMIGKEKDERELIQLEQKHRQELKQLRDHHATKAQLAEATRLQEREKEDLTAQQKLEKTRALALAEIQITQQKTEEQAAWQQRLDDFQVRTGRMGEEEALTRRYERERQVMTAKQATLAVQIEQEKSDAKRLELEAQYWTLEQQIRNSHVSEGQDKAIAARNLADAYAEINIRLKEMAGLLEEAERARQKLFWESASGRQLINDAMADKPGAADAYYAQERMDRQNLQNAGLQDPVNGPNGLRNQLRIAGLERQDPYAAQTEQLQQSYLEQLRIADNYYAEKEGKEREHAALVEQIQQEHAAKMKQVEVDRWKAAAGTVASYMGQMAQELMQGNKEQFEIGKRMAQATAAIQGALAIIQAYGQLGPIAGTVAAVVIGAVTLQQIAKIDSQQYTATRAMGGSVEKGRAYLTGEHGREVFVPDDNGTIYPNGTRFGRGQAMSFTNVFQVSTGVTATVQAELMRMVPALQQMAVSSVMQAMRNGDFQEAV